MVVHDLDALGALRVALRPRETRGTRRVALVHEGGGMRSAFGAGVLDQLAAHGLDAAAFDGFFGVSAGLLNLAYFVSGRVVDAVAIYPELLASDPPFYLFDSRADLLARLVRGQPALDLAAVQRSLEQVRPLDLMAVRNHPAPLWFPITDAERLETSFIDARNVPEARLLSTLLAAASMPGLAEPPVLPGGRWVDGACGDALPIREAHARGFTDLVLVLSLPARVDSPWYEPWALAALGPRRGLPWRLGDLVRRTRATRRRLLDGRDGLPAGMCITMLGPEAKPGSTLERDPRVLAAAVTHGRDVARTAIAAARR